MGVHIRYIPAFIGVMGNTKFTEHIQTITRIQVLETRGLNTIYNFVYSTITFHVSPIQVSFYNKERQQNLIKTPNRICLVFWSLPGSTVLQRGELAVPFDFESCK
ncbi:hypothetical protein TMatcc_005141 [Talaromyces marneffei ATCC 18224]